MVETPMATRKIHWSWLQHRYSSQFTFISLASLSPSTAEVDLEAVRWGAVSFDERRGNKFCQFHYGKRRGEGVGRLCSWGRGTTAIGWLAVAP
jgi:hypothetical protein